MIELAPDEHLHNMKPLDEFDLEVGVFETIEDFRFSVKSTAFSCDETGYWACEYDGKKYIGENIQASAKPECATHVYWFGK